MEANVSDRRNCAHPVNEFVVCIIQWCARCSGWRYKRVGVEPGSTLDTGSAKVYESHFLEAEETTPDTILALTTRAFRSAQEWQQELWEATWCRDHL